MTNSFLSILEEKINHRFDEYRNFSPEEQLRVVIEKAAIHEYGVHTKEQLLEMLKTDNHKDISVKFGIDPTGPDVHLGHLVPVLMLKRFASFGFHIDFIVGDFTAAVGDPSGRTAERAQMSFEQASKNASKYFSQINKVLNLDAKNIDLHYNSFWLSKVNLLEFIKLLQEISSAKLLQREDFKKRIEVGNSPAMAELVYPILMGMDSANLKSSIEIGGIDQMLNFFMCREVMSLNKQVPEIFVVVDLVPGTSGEKNENGILVKMSKSKDNYIPVVDTHYDIYAKTMSIPDETMWVWYRLLTEISNDELDELKRKSFSGDINPKIVKQLLARLILRMLSYENKSINEAEEDFNSKFSSQLKIDKNSLEKIVIFNKNEIRSKISKVMNISLSELRRLNDSGSIKIINDGEQRKTSLDCLLDDIGDDEIVIKIGKKKFFLISTK